MRAGADRYDALRDVVSDLGRQAKTNVVAGRALSGAFATYFTDGWVRFDGRDPAAAVESLEIAAIIRPEVPMTYVALAKAHLFRGEKREAREALQVAIAKGFDDQEQIGQMRKSLAP
jgi:hypothetical protein